MEINLPSSTKFIVAVSGGVDSMVLLDLMSRQLNDRQLIVAHFDHGIRPDSAVDRQLVQAEAKRLNLRFVFEDANLGPAASEALARQRRYQFLDRVAKEHGAMVVTAHHQDDLIETAIINLHRGTGRKGLTALSSRPDRLRPLLSYPKQQLIDYATEHQLVWHEDSTNQDTRYLRNYVRQAIVSRLTKSDRLQLVELINHLSDINLEMDELLSHLLTPQVELKRAWFNKLPHNLAKEVLASWLRQNGLADFNRAGLDRLVIAAKTGHPDRRYPVINGAHMQVKRTNLALVA